MFPSILLIAPDTTALPIAAALQLDLRAEVETAPNRRAALACLRRREFALILIDESLATADTAAADLLYQNAGSALLVELNFGISSAARIVRQARASLTRRTQDRAAARATAIADLHNELNARLAGILLEAQLAHRDATPAQAPRLSNLVQLATGLRDRLRT
jgi:hypothetical protein